MFSNLMASKPQRRPIGAPAWGVSMIVHAVGVLIFVSAATRLDEQRSKVLFEPVTFVDITQEPEAAAPQPDPEPQRAPEPEPPQAAEGDATRDVPDPELPAGYQVLASPDERVGIPAPGLTEIRAEDFSGRGVAGGVGGGLPPKLTPLADRAAAPEPAVSVTTVDEPPRVTNAAEIAARMEELYPMGLRLGRVSGEVVIQLIVDAKGHVEAQGDTIVSSSHRELEWPTRAVARMVRFEPARRNGTPVRVWVRLPVTWIAD
jgi:protein TonB